MPTKTRPATSDVRSRSCLRTTYLQGSSAQLKAQVQGAGDGTGVRFDGADELAADTVEMAAVGQPDRAETDLGVQDDAGSGGHQDHQGPGAEVAAYVDGGRGERQPGQVQLGVACSPAVAVRRQRADAGGTPVDV